jgi:hypothetical protein
MTIRDACAAWLKPCERGGLERATIRSYRGHVIHHIEPRLGEMALEDLTRAHVRDFLDDL